MGAHTVALVALLALIGPPLLAAGAGSPLEEFGKCRSRCYKKYYECNTDISLMEKCFFEYDLECACACKRHLPAAPTTEAPTTPAPAPTTAAPNPPRAAVTMFSDDYDKAFTCNTNAQIEMSTCVTPCEATKDEACATACVRPYIEKVCQCDQRGSTTIAPKPQSSTVPPPRSTTANPPKSTTSNTPKTTTSNPPKSTTSNPPKSTTSNPPKSTTSNPPKSTTSNPPKPTTAPPRPPTVPPPRPPTTSAPETSTKASGAGSPLAGRATVVLSCLVAWTLVRG